MTLRSRVLVTSVLIALPAAALTAWAVDRARAKDMELALTRVVRSQVNEQVRERCESDPRWFLTGPLIGRPPRGVFTSTDPNALEPRPRVTPQPFELFAYDEMFLGTSSGAAQFPREFRQVLQSSSDLATAPYRTGAGTGVQVAVPTGWIGGPCMYFLGRMEPPPDQFKQRVTLVGALFLLFLLTGWLATAPTVWRTRRLARDMRESVDAAYKTIAPDTSRDELSSLAFMFNDAATELHQRKARIDDQDEALKRFVNATDEDIAKPLAALADRLGAAASGPGAASDAVTRKALVDAHEMLGRVENLTAAARLRLRGAIGKTTIDLADLVSHVVSSQRPFAEARGVSIDAPVPELRASIEGDELLISRAIANVIDNAIRYSHPGGVVRVVLDADKTNLRFTLRVTDEGKGVSEEEFRGLTAIRRFRGDEGRNRRPGAPGLGLAVTREVADRSGLSFVLERRETGGMAAELTGALKA